MRASDQRSRQRGRLSRKDLKAPDEFITLTGRALNFTGQHLRTIAFLFGGIAATVVVVGALLTYLHRVERQAFADIWQIEAQLRNAADAQTLPAETIERLRHITQQFGAGAARAYAWLYLGHAHSRQGDHAAAAEAYRQAMALTQSSSLLWTLASMSMAYALEADQQIEPAQEAYQRVIDAKPTGFLLEAYLGKGRVAEQRQDVETALTAYSTAIELFPARAEALGLADKVAALKAPR
jgi:tetratricopeptide (TPR) repeat protein